MAYEDPVVFVTSGAKTTSGNSGAIPCPKGLQLAIAVAVSAVGGTTPSMTLTVEWSQDGSTFHTSDPVDSFTAITANGNVAKSFTVKGSFFRLVWTITGTTPTFTIAASRYVAGD